MKWGCPVTRWFTDHVSRWHLVKLGFAAAYFSGERRLAFAKVGGPVVIIWCWTLCLAAGSVMQGLQTAKSSAKMVPNSLLGVACDNCELQAVQNFAARINTNSRKFDNVNPLLCQLHWLPVKSHLFYRVAILTFKCMNETAPDYLWKRFVNRGGISGRCTRNSQSLNIPLHKSATGQRTFYYSAVSLWNDLPVNIKTSTTLNILKKNLRSHLFETLNF